LKRLLAVLAACGLIAAAAGSATAGQDAFIQTEKQRRDAVEGSRSGQHGVAEGHLAASKRNMKLVSKLQLTDIEGGISDVNYLKGFAYVGKYNVACVGRGGTGAGVSVVNIKRPRSPRQVAFIEAGTDAYVSEGVQAIHIDTRRFSGDILLHSNEPCDADVDDAGGVSIYDVSDPRNPRQLVDQFGDTDPNDTDPTDGIDPALETPNAVHSIFGWDAGNRAYVALVDNEEGLDVDILDITNPRRPRLISETGLEEWAEISPQLAHGESYFHHDLMVKRIGGHWYGIVSYWDAGQVLLNLDDPANPVFVRDSDYLAQDPQLPQFTPEGNAHQADWSSNNKWIVGTDEDFAPYRLRFNITTGDNAGEFPGAEFGWTIPIADNFEDRQINGPTIYGGTGCPAVPDDPTTPEDESVPATADDIPPATDLRVEPGEETILVLIRGGCFFSEKVEAGENAGYDVVIVANSHAGAANGDAPDAVLCGSKGHDYDPTISGVCIGHRAFHLLFDTAPGFDATETAPQIGDLGADIQAAPTFDGWGYVHLYDAQTLQEIDSYAVPEAIDEQFANIYPLSVHEVKTDRRRGVNLGYVSWYQAGARVLKFGRNGINEVGHYIGRGGNNFWGTFPVKRGNRRPLLLFSDRDFGLYILKYTGRQ